MVKDVQPFPNTARYFFGVSIQNLLDGRLNQNGTDLLSFFILLQGNPRPVAVLGTRMKM